MSEATETVQSLYDGFAAGTLEAVLDLLDPSVEWVTPPTLPWSCGRYEGRDEVAGYFESFGAALTQARVVPEQIHESGECVFALGREEGVSRATGRRFSAPFAHVFTLREARIAAFRGHIDTAAICDAFTSGDAASDLPAHTGSGIP